MKGGGVVPDAGGRRASRPTGESATNLHFEAQGRALCVAANRQKRMSRVRTNPNLCTAAIFCIVRAQTGFDGRKCVPYRGMARKPMAAFWWLESRCAGVVQWQNGSFPSFIQGFDSPHRSTSLQVVDSIKEIQPPSPPIQNPQAKRVRKWVEFARCGQCVRGSVDSPKAAPSVPGQAV